MIASYLFSLSMYYLRDLLMDPWDLYFICILLVVSFATTNLCIISMQMISTSIYLWIPLFLVMLIMVCLESLVVLRISIPG